MKPDVDTYTCDQGHVLPISQQVCPHCTRAYDERRAFIGNPDEFDPRVAEHLAWAKWLGTIFQIGGALCLATHRVAPQVCYAVMFIGSAAWASVAAIRQDKPLLTLNLLYSALNVIGMAAWR